MKEMRKMNSLLILVLLISSITSITLPKASGAGAFYVFSVNYSPDFEYIVEEIEPLDNSSHLVAEYYPLPNPKKVSVYVEVEDDGDGFALEVEDVFSVWVELYMNGTWKPLISQQNWERTRDPLVLWPLFNGPEPIGMISPWYMIPLYMEGGYVNNSKFILGEFFPNSSIPNLFSGEVLLVEDQVPVAEGIRVYIQRLVSGGADNETFTFQTVIQGWGEEGVAAISSSIQDVQDTLNDPEYGLEEIKTEIRDIENVLNSILDKLGLPPVGGLILPMSLPALFGGLFPYLLALTIGLIILAWINKKS